MTDPVNAQRRDWFAQNHEVDKMPTGRLAPTVPIVLTEADEARFWKKVALPNPDGCMLWTAATDRHGYGHLRASGHLFAAHRIAYFLANGPIPQGMDMDHMCHVRPCVAPDHLRAVTRKQNCENLTGPQRQNASGFRGVSWDATYGKWRARAGHNGEDVFFGYFEDVAEAAEAARLGRLRLFTHSDADKYDAIMPRDPDERADYLAELAKEAANGPAAGQEAVGQ